MLGECSVEGFVWRSCFVGDRVDLVLRRDGTKIVPKPPRGLARWSLDLLLLQSTCGWIDEGLQLNNQRWIVVWFGIGVGVEVRVVRGDLLRLKLFN